VLITPSGKRRTLDRCGGYACKRWKLTHGMAVWINGGVVKTQLLSARTRAAYRLAADPSPGSREIGLIASVTSTHLIADAPGGAERPEHPLYAASLSELRSRLCEKR
jgi:hypothetical protein